MQQWLYSCLRITIVHIVTPLRTYIDIINSGGLVAFPTETVYGLGADATNPDAIRKVFETKGRPSDNPLIVHVSSLDQLKDFIVDIPVPKLPAQLIMECWPGALTLIFNKKDTVLDAVTAGLNTVAVRMPDSPIALDFIAQTGPLVAPSANTSGKPSPTKAEHVKADFGEEFPVIDDGATSIGLESTVLDVTAEPFKIYRPGYVTKEEIEIITGFEVVYVNHSEDQPSPSPGVKYSHYSPNASVQWWDYSEPKDDSLYLVHKTELAEAPNVVNYGSYIGALGQGLYDQFRKADMQGFAHVLIEPFEGDELLVPALRNRIEKAIG